MTDTDRIIREDKLEDIQRLFYNGTKNDHKYRYFPTILSCSVIFVSVMAYHFGNISAGSFLSLCSDISVFAVTYSAVAAGILIAGFSIVVSTLDAKLINVFSQIRQPVAESNLISFVFSIFVASLIVYVKLFAWSFLGVIMCGEDRFFIFSYSGGSSYEEFLLFLLVGFTSILTFITFYSILFLKAFVLNLHGTLSLLVEARAGMDGEQASKNG